MAIDSRISLAVRAPDVAPAINIFENALMNAQTRDLRSAQEARRQELAPFQLQQAQRQETTGRQQQRLSNIHQTGQRLKPFLESGNISGANEFLVNNIAEIQNRINQGSGENIEDSMEMLGKLQREDIQGALGDINAVAGLVTGGAGQRPLQFGAQQTFKDAKGNLFFGTTKRDPVSGEVVSVLASVSGDQSQPDGQVSLVSGLGQTATEKAETEVSTTQKVEDIKATAKGKSEAIKAGVGQAVKAFEKIPLVRTAINNYGEAIAALDAGAETGTIDAMLPSLTRASKELDNVIKRLGLDVVGNTTFGALSESELKFALKAAIPDNLQPAQLKEWLTAKRNAQQKILGGLNEMSNFLGDGTKTIADWNNQQALKSLSGTGQSEQVQAEVVPQQADPAPTNAQPTQINQRQDGQIMTDAAGNRAMVFPDGTFEEL